MIMPSTPATVPSLEIRSRSSALGINYGFHRSPLGRCLVGLSDGRICYLAFVTASDREMLADLAARWPAAGLSEAAEATGRIVEDLFSDSGANSVGLLVSGTPFQIDVWEALLQIPAGTVSSYAAIARRVGRPRATRAVGTAIGANPISWLIPCHRVVRSDGSLGGYRWGLKAKRACLDYEKRQIAI